MNHQERERLQLLRDAIAARPGRYDQRRIRVPPRSGEPRGCAASLLVAVDERARKLFAGDIEPTLIVPPNRRRGFDLPEATGSVLRSATYALGRGEVPQLLRREWPAEWYRQAGVTTPREAEKAPEAAEALAIIALVLGGKLPDALEPPGR